LLAFSALVLFVSIPLASMAGEAETIAELLDGLDSRACAQCHKEVYGQWERSFHSKSLVSALPGMRNFFKAGVPEEWKRKLSKEDVVKCLDCHAPAVRSASEELALELASMAVRAQESTDEKEKALFREQLSGLNVGCMACHNLKATSAMAGALGEPEKGAVYSPHPGETGAHKTLRSEAMGVSLFCAQCHRTYTAPDGDVVQCTTIAGSYYDNYVPGGGSQRCQDCHMREAGRGHAMPGGHSADMVKAALDLSAEVRPFVEPPEKGGAAWRPAALVTVWVKNAAGHRVPDG
jgi:hypothetical protein